MAIIRLPVCGDYIEQTLVCGVSARGFRGQPSIVTVWVAPSSEIADDMFVFQQFEVATLARAQMVRDQIADLCGLDVDEDDEDGGGDDEDEIEGGDGEDDEDEDDRDFDASGVDTEQLSPAEAREILELWDTASKSMN